MNFANDHFNDILPLSLSYILMECYERELSHQPPLNGADKNLKLLLEKEFVEIKTCTDGNGKLYNGAFITNAGKNYLDLQDARLY